MNKRLILGFISITLNFILAVPLLAQSQDSLKLSQEGNLNNKLSKESSQKEKPFFSGVSVSGDLVGLACKAFSSYGQYEGAFRINLKERFFPIVELGIGQCDKTDEATDLHYKTTAPYIRIGCDYNILKDKYSGNRVFIGFRTAYTNFKFNIEGPDQADPVWGDKVPFHYKNQKASCFWGEIVGGLEAKIWSILHLGWTIRCRFRASQHKSNVGEAWYIPGFGRNGSTRLGASFNVIFDI